VDCGNCALDVRCLNDCLVCPIERDTVRELIVKSGIISLSGKEISILDYKRLEQISHAG
jgi:hypothetical protein